MKQFISGFVTCAVICALLFMGSSAIADSPIKLYMNGQPIQCDVPPQNINGRVMVPARFVAEPLGATVQWDAENQAVIISSTSQVAKTEDSLNTTTEKIYRKSDLPITIKAKNGMQMVIHSYTANTSGNKFNITLTNTSMTDKGHTMTTSWTVYDGKNVLKSVSQEDVFYDNWLNLRSGQSVRGDAIYEGLSYNATTFYWEISLDNGSNSEKFKLKFAI